MITEFLQENDASRKQLTEFASRLDDAGFNCVVSGWTVATWLCHLAFWDRAMLSLLTRLQGPDAPAPKLDMTAIHSINDACQFLAHSIPGPAAARMAIESAEAVDSYVAGLDEAAVTRLAQLGLERLLRRSLHRLAHVEKMTEAVQCGAVRK